MGAVYSYYKVDDEITPEAFKKEALKDLACQKTVVGDVFSSQFLDVKRIERTYLRIKANIKLYYDVTVCKNKSRDEKESYKVYDFATKKYKKETQTKTITWVERRPHSGTKTMSSVATIGIDFDEYDDEKIRSKFSNDFDSWITNRNIHQIYAIGNYEGLGERVHKKIQDEKIVPVTIDILENATIKAIRDSLPGDFSEDLKYKSVVDFEIETYIIPYYVLEYTYNGNKYTAGGFSSLDNYFSHLAPSDVDTIESRAYEDHHGLAAASFISLISAGLYIAVCIILRMSGVYKIGGWLFLASLIMVLFVIILSKIPFKLIKKTEENYYDYNAEERRVGLNQKLKELDKE